jgi:hypothetical protein
LRRTAAVITMKRVVAAITFALLAGAAGAAERRDPLAGSASAGASLPELSGRADAAKNVGARQPRPLGERYLERRPSLGPRPYWESNPLFTAPPP